jgi:hypothetical protein
MGRQIHHAVFVSLCLALAAAFLAAAHADTVVLKNGTTIEGTIVAEDDSQLTIEVQYAGGTITKRDTISKSDIAEIRRLTDEEKAWLEVQQLALNPLSSFSLERYDTAIHGVFRPFLERFPDSAHREEVTAKLALWEAERAQVAAGMTKYRGQWMSAADAVKQAERERIEQLLQQGKDLLVQGRYEQAVQQYTTASAMTKRPDLLLEIRRLQADAYRLWLDSLDQQRQKLSKEIERYQQEAERARQAGQQTEAARWEKQLGVLRAQLDTVQKEIAAVQPRAEKFGVKIEVAQPAAAARDLPGTKDVPPGPAYEPPEWQKMVHWLKDKWIFLVGGVLLIAILFSKILFGR